jgi:putative methionine-R-sulfoxide reductase with GAF domain
MNRYSILNQSPSPLPLEPASVNGAPGEPPAPAGHGLLHFPGDDSGKSPSDMAQNDLRAALQLLAERAQYITGASGAAIALREGSHMICRASAGASAPEPGAHLQVNSGLSGESVRIRQILRCDDAETDARVNRESCRALGIASVVVMPLLGEEEVIGVFELFSSRAYAFEERDIVALQRIADMIRTAVDHAEAVQRAQARIARDEDDEVLFVDLAEDCPRSPDPPALPREHPAPSLDVVPAGIPPAREPGTSAAANDPHPAVLLGEPAAIHKCAVCGFPVSQERAFCLDCEAAGSSAAPSATDSGLELSPAFLSGYAGKQSGGLLSGRYWLVMLLLVLMVLAALHWLR